MSKRSCSNQDSSRPQGCESKHPSGAQSPVGALQGASSRARAHARDCAQGGWCLAPAGPALATFLADAWLAGRGRKLATARGPGAPESSRVGGSQDAESPGIYKMNT